MQHYRAQAQNYAEHRCSITQSTDAALCTEHKNSNAQSRITLIHTAVLLSIIQ